MNIGIISCKKKNIKMKKELADYFAGSGHKVVLWDPLSPEKISPDEWIREQFGLCDGLIFFDSCETVLYKIAPWIKSKKTDPAIVVVEPEKGYVISLLSGHIGGANELAEQISSFVHGISVVTTATDLSKKFAVDVFATKNDCVISSMVLAKEISAALVNGDPVGFFSDIEWDGTLPEGIIPYKKGEKMPSVGFCVSYRPEIKPFDKTLLLSPKNIIAGVGCKKGTSMECIEERIKSICEEENIPFTAIARVASIDLKKEEGGMIGFCRKYDLPFTVFTKEELMAVPGEFTGSEFVRKITGVENVCERSALLAAGRDGELMIKKHAGNGVTAAFAVKKRRVHFE